MRDSRALVLKLAATALAVGATALSAVFVTSHLKNANAPLQPSVLNASDLSGLSVPGGGTLILSPSVRQTDVPPVTSTYAS